MNNNQPLIVKSLEASFKAMQGICKSHALTCKKRDIMHPEPVFFETKITEEYLKKCISEIFDKKRSSEIPTIQIPVSQSNFKKLLSILEHIKKNEEIAMEQKRNKKKKYCK